MAGDGSDEQLVHLKDPPSGIVVEAPFLSPADEAAPDIEVPGRLVGIRNVQAEG